MLPAYDILYNAYFVYTMKNAVLDLKLGKLKEKLKLGKGKAAKAD